MRYIGSTQIWHIHIPSYWLIGVRAFYINLGGNILGWCRAAPRGQDPRDPRDPRMSSKASIFNNPSVDSERKSGKDFPKVSPNLKKSLPVYAKRLLAPKELFWDSDKKIPSGGDLNI